MDDFWRVSNQFLQISIVFIIFRPPPLPIRRTHINIILRVHDVFTVTRKRKKIVARKFRFMYYTAYDLRQLYRYHSKHVLPCYVIRSLYIAVYTIFQYLYYYGLCPASVCTRMKYCILGGGSLRRVCLRRVCRTAGKNKIISDTFVRGWKKSGCEKRYGYAAVDH